MPTSGTFSLTGDVSFGPTFGLVSQYFKTATTIPATAGFIRLSKTDSIDWRNNANSADLALAINGSDQLTFAGTPITVGGVTSITGTANQIIASAATGAVTLSTPQSIAPTSSPTFAVLTLSAPLTVPNGGTGDASFTAYSVVCGGTTSVNSLQNVASIGISGQFLQSNGAGLLPTWANAAGTGTVNSAPTAGALAYYATASNVVSSSQSANPFTSQLTLKGNIQQLILAPTSGSTSTVLSAPAPATNVVYLIPDRGGNDTFAFLGSQAQSFSGDTTFTSTAGVTITPTTNQLVLGITRTTTISAAQPATSSRVVTIPDPGGNVNLMMSANNPAAMDMNSHKITGTTQGTSTGEVVVFPATSIATTGSAGGIGGTLVDSFTLPNVLNKWVMVTGHIDLNVTSTAGGVVDFDGVINFNGASLPGGRTHVKYTGAATASNIVTVPIFATFQSTVNGTAALESYYSTNSGTAVSVALHGLSYVIFNA